MKYSRVILLSILLILFSEIISLPVVEAGKDFSWNWGSRARQRCRKLTRGKQVPDGICSIFQEIVEESFDLLTVNMANLIGTTSFTEMSERAETDPWNVAGINMLDEMVHWMMRTKPKKTEDIKKEFDQKCMGWMLKLAAADRNGLNVLPPGVSFPGMGDPSMRKNAPSDKEL